MIESDSGLNIHLAGRVQKLLFPKSLPLCSWCCMGVKNRMANGLGGDYFDFIPMPDGCQLVMLGDVTGHGLEASVVMSLLYGFLHRASLNQCAPVKVVTDINSFLEDFASRAEELDHLFSTTLFCAIIHPETLHMRYVNAGQVPPMVRRSGAIMDLRTTAPPLGFFSAPDIGIADFQLQKGDRLVLFTDGVTETFDKEGRQFGRERLKNFCCVMIRGISVFSTIFLKN